MLINIHKLYLLKKFTKKIFVISFFFLILVLIINLLEEINFLKETETSILTPILLTILNAPSLLYQMFPFIFLISTQFFFIEMYQNREIYTLRQFGIDNFSLLKFILTSSFLFGAIVIIVFYNFSSILKNEYLQIKNKFADDNKYLAVITKNGIWIKDNLDDKTVIINADKIQNEFLLNASITEFDQDFKIIQNIISNKINIKEEEWLMFNPIITKSDNSSKNLDKLIFKTSFDLEKINNLFSDLSALTYFELIKLQNDYESIGYSIDEIEIQKHKFYSLPFLLCVMSVIGTIIMIYNKFKKNLLLNLFIGIFISVSVYYLGHFSNLLGENGRLPLILSVWFPVLMLLSLSAIGVIKLNEK